MGAVVTLWLFFVAVMIATVSPCSAGNKARIAQCAGRTYITEPGGRNFCEQHWFAQAECSGQDQLPLGSGHPNPTTTIIPLPPGPGGVVPPWESSSISIRKVTIVFMHEAGTIKNGYVFAGNNYTHDVMAWLDPVREGRVTESYPDGLSFQLPDKSNVNNWIDLHVMCQPVGVAYSAFLIVYYTINE